MMREHVERIARACNRFACTPRHATTAPATPPRLTALSSANVSDARSRIGGDDAFSYRIATPVSYLHHNVKREPIV